MIRAIIIDDEKNSLEVTEILLRKYCPNVELSALCTSGEQGIEAIRKYRPDVVFLDIKMPKMNGFEMLEEFNKIFFNVVFITAYDSFALKAFKYSAVNYLLKPIDPNDLVETVKRIEENKLLPTQEQMLSLFGTMKNTPRLPERGALSTSEGLVFALTKDIMYCEGESNYTRVALATGEKILVAKTLKEIDETLSGPEFFRIHKSFFVNLNFIKKFIREEGGYVIMKDGTEIGIARSRRDEFFAMFSKF